LELGGAQRGQRHSSPPAGSKVSDEGQDFGAMPPEAIAVMLLVA